MISGVELEERLAPIVTAIGLLEVIVSKNANVFCAVQNAIFMPVVDNLMTPVGHHFAKLNYLLRVSAGVKPFACNCVR